MTVTALENIGATNVSLELAEVDFAGGKHYAFKISGEINGVSFKETVVTVKRGGRFANTTVFSFNEDIDDILDYFKAV